MPFDPSLPATGSKLQSAVIRGNFNGLKDLIDAVPTITSAVIDSVTTGNPGDPASVTASVTDGVLHLTFSLPRGDAGPTGAQGIPGEVSLTDLNNGLQNVLSQSSANSNTVSTLGGPYTDPEAEELRQKMNELIAALRR